MTQRICKSFLNAQALQWTWEEQLEPNSVSLERWQIFISSGYQMQLLRRYVHLTIAITDSIQYYFTIAIHIDLTWPFWMTSCIGSVRYRLQTRMISITLHCHLVVQQFSCYLPQHPLSLSLLTAAAPISPIIISDAATPIRYAPQYRRVISSQVHGAQYCVATMRKL